MIQYFKRPAHQLIVSRPLMKLAEQIVLMKCKVKGGGLTGQGSNHSQYIRALVSR